MNRKSAVVRERFYVNKRKKKKKNGKRGLPGGAGGQYCSKIVQISILVPNGRCEKCKK
jgi:hypothetical protein